MNQLFKKKWFPHVAAILIGLLTICIYCSPMFSGKTLKQYDVKQWQGMSNEIGKYYDQTGERTFWTNSMFGGMPAYLISPYYQGTITTRISQGISMALPNPLDTLFLLFICAYIMLIAFDISPWLSIVGGLAFMLSTFNLVNIDAGHMTKGIAIAYMPLVLAGIHITLHKNRLLGALLTGIALSFELQAGHVQISYYLMMIIITWMIVEAVVAVKNKKVMNLFLSGVFLLLAAGLGIATNATSLMATEEYGKYSIRGKSELTKTPEGSSNSSTASSGLDKDYALQWSHGVLEPLTILIPDLYGGASSSELSLNSETYQLLKQNGVPNAKQVIQGMPVYWGDLPFTAGPIYFGAIICYLFVLGIFLIKGHDKWWILIIAFLTIFLSMGKNFMWLTDIFFYYVPFYNKFRSVNFMLCVAQTLFPLLGLMAIRDIMNGKVKTEDAKKALLYSFYIVGGLCLLFLAVPGLFFDYVSPLDERLPEWLRGSLVNDRESILRMDALRSLLFITAAFALLWFFLVKKVKLEYMILGLILLVTIDLWGVDKRYVNSTDFETKKKNLDLSFPKSAADEVILQDKDPDYRVYNTTQRLDQDALTSYWHKSIGGYHGAKMRRYQELIEFQMAKGNPEVFNMLNVKYFIIGDSTNNVYPQLNPAANGHAWFVKDYMLVDNADAEIDSISHFNSKTTAVIDKRFADQVNGLNIVPDSSATIKLLSYAPNRLVYESEASGDQLAVFSEIYYEKGWNVTVDDQPATHFRCNYVLRGMKVPAGKHKIQFVFEPKVVSTMEPVALGSSLVLYVGAAGLLVVEYLRRKKKKQENKA